MVIIGGGITGACVAHDAALRGLKVALVEKDDFGGATSSASSKLLHGGIRYLQQHRPGKVRESLRERQNFRRIAPHLTRWVPFLVPTQPEFWRRRWLLECGMRVYAGLGGNRGVDIAPESDPPGTYYNRRMLQRLAPVIAEGRKITGAHLLYELHLHSSERMTLAFLKSAVHRGAVIANYVTVDGLLRRGSRVEGVVASDRIGGGRLEIRGRVVANAAGPWLANLNERLTVGALRRPVTGLAKGAHLVTRQLVDGYAVALPTDRAVRAVVDRGGRHVFVIPWRGHSLIGTTNRLHEDQPALITPTETDVQDLLEDVRRALPLTGLTERDVCHAFAGLYPLTTKGATSDVYQATADYEVRDHSQSGGLGGIVSVLGARYTTARVLAEYATDLIFEKLGQPVAQSLTSTTPLAGGDMDDCETFAKESVRRHANHLDRSTVEHLVRHYGTEMDSVVASAAGEVQGLRRLSTKRPSIEAEVSFAVDYEMAQRLTDVIFRRTGLGTLGHPGDGCLERCADIMAARLSWTGQERQEQLQQTRRHFQFSVS